MNYEGELMEGNILVAGATGRTGRLIVAGLRQLGRKPTVLVRDVPKAKKILGEDLVFHRGDVRDYESLLDPMEGIDVVVSAIGSRSPVGKNCPKHVDFEGVSNLVRAARQKDVSRFILISSIAVTNPNHPMNCFGHVLEWKYKGESFLRESGLDYVIIRPGGLTNAFEGDENLRIDQGDRLSGMVSRDAVASVVLHAIHNPQTSGVSFEVIAVDQPEEKNWPEGYAALSPD